nr:MAG TPA: hypothetical protein [Caudoviricetes sp.]
MKGKVRGGFGAHPPSKKHPPPPTFNYYKK